MCPADLIGCEIGPNCSRMWTWLMSLDPPTRAALIAGAATVLSVFGALCGVYANLAWNRKKHRDEKSYNLRRDIYLEFIAIIYRTLVNLADRVVPKKDGKLSDEDTADVTQQFYSTCAKTQIIGERRVVAAILAFQEVYEELSDGARTKRDAYKAAVERAEGLPKDVEKTMWRIDQFVSEIGINDKKEIVVTDAARAEEVVEKVEGFVKEINGTIESFATMVDDFCQKVGDCVSYIISIAEKSGRPLHELIVAMKSDLGIRIDETWYADTVQALLQRSITSMRERAEGSIKQLRAKSASLHEMKVTLTLAANSNTTQINLKRSAGGNDPFN